MQSAARAKRRAKPALKNVKAVPKKKNPVKPLWRRVLWYITMALMIGVFLIAVRHLVMHYLHLVSQI